MEIKIPRVDVTPGINGAQWSADGDIAVATTSNIFILSPDNETQQDWVQTSTEAGTECTSGATSNSSESATAAITAEATIPKIGVVDPYIAIGWSPSGMSNNRSCYLAGLKSSGLFTIYHNDKRPLGGTWTVRWRPGTPIFSVKSFAWSPRVPTSASLWGCCFLALATENMIYVFKVEDDDFGMFQTLETSMFYAKAMKWCPYLTDKLVLAVVSNDNAVYKIKIPLELKDRISIPPSLLSASRFLTSIYWIDEMLIVYQPGKIYLFLKDTLVPKVHQTSLFLPVTGLVNLKNPGGSSDWILFTSNGKSFSIAETPWVNTIRKFLNHGSDCNYTIIGACQHEITNLYAIAYMVHMQGAWRFPIPSTESIRLKIGNLKANGWQYHAISGSPRSRLWLRHFQNNIQAPRISSGFTIIEHVRTMTLASFRYQFSAFALDSKLDLLRQRVQQGDKEAKDIIRTSLARLVVAFGQSVDASSLHTYDRAVYRSYQVVLNEEQDDNVPVDLIGISGNFFEEIFDFSSKNMSEIVSTGGRIWRRCAITLLPLLTPRTLEVDGYASIDVSILPASSIIALPMLQAIDFCIFTGGRWCSR